MNNPKTFSKIIISALGIYLLIRMIPQFFVSFCILCTSWGGLKMSILFLLYIVGAAGLCISLVWIFLIWNREWLADRMIRGIEQEEAKISPAGWILFGYRMACFAAGLLCCYHFLIGSQSVFRSTLFYLEQGLKARFSDLLQSIGVLLLLPAGIYLLCGAPALVRRQVAKTLEMCDEYMRSEEKTGNLQSRGKE